MDPKTSTPILFDFRLQKTVSTNFNKIWVRDLNFCILTVQLTANVILAKTGVSLSFPLGKQGFLSSSMGQICPFVRQIPAGQDNPDVVVILKDWYLQQELRNWGRWMKVEGEVWLWHLEAGPT